MAGILYIASLPITSVAGSISRRRPPMEQLHFPTSPALGKTFRTAVSPFPKADVAVAPMGARQDSLRRGIFNRPPEPHVGAAVDGRKTQRIGKSLLPNALCRESGDLLLSPARVNTLSKENTARVRLPLRSQPCPPRSRDAQKPQSSERGYRVLADGQR